MGEKKKKKKKRKDLPQDQETPVLLHQQTGHPARSPDVMRAPSA